MVQAPTPERRDQRHGGAWWGWLAVGTFVLGLLAGALLAGLLGQTRPVAPTAQDDPPAQSPPGGPTPSTPEGADGTRVNEACLRAINAAQDVAAAVEDVGTAAAALDAAQLDEAIRRLQPLQQRLQENSADCRVTGTPSSERSPTAPSAPPTD